MIETLFFVSKNKLYVTNYKVGQGHPKISTITLSLSGHEMFDLIIFTHQPAKTFLGPYTNNTRGALHYMRFFVVFFFVLKSN